MTETNFSDEPSFNFDEDNMPIVAPKKRGRPKKVAAEQIEQTAPPRQFTGDTPQFTQHKNLRSPDGLIRPIRHAYNSSPPVLHRFEGVNKVSWKTNYDPRNAGTMALHVSRSRPVYTKPGDFVTRKGGAIGVSRDLAESRRNMEVPAFGNQQAMYGPARKRNSF